MMKETSKNSQHEPVLLGEVLEVLRPGAGEVVVDCTVGYGGHAEAILSHLSSKGKLIAMDLDPYALDATQQRLSDSNKSFSLHQGNFREFPLLLQSLGIDKLTGALFDIGFSSSQIDSGHRGFSFQAEAPLNMRFNPNAGITARDFLNKSTEIELSAVIKEFGEERYHRKITKAVFKAVKAGKMETTTDLRNAVAEIIPGRFLTKSLARVFQAIRIKVNDELDALKETLVHSVQWLQIGGRLTVISFHSLEDRIVKQFYKNSVKSCICPKEYPVCICNASPTLKFINKKAIVPRSDELETNARARSAKLRVAERI